MVQVLNLGVLPRNVICDFDIANYANNNTPYLSGKNVEEVLVGLQNVLANLFQLFTENELERNASKYVIYW